MKRLIILAALLLSVVGGLTLMSSSSPLAAQTDPSATRSFDPAKVEPGGTVIVSIDVQGITAVAGRVTETMPDGFTFVSTTNSLGRGGTGSELSFRVLGDGSFTYTLTAPDTENTYTFRGILNPGPGVDDVDVGGASEVTVETIPEQTGPQPKDNDLQFDVVASKAVKGAQVSQVGMPIDSNPLTWVIDTEDTLGDFNGAVGDFVVEETEDGSNKFVLKVATSGAPNLSTSQSISVDLPYTNADDEVLTTTLTGVITERESLDITGPGSFTIPQGISNGTLIGNFKVDGRIGDEYLDGILTGDGSGLFAVNDRDMTLMYKGGGLDVGTYNLELTVSGDAGLANRTNKVDVDVIVTASNTAPKVLGELTKTLPEDLKGDGLVSAKTAVGDAKALIENADNDTLTFKIVGDDSGLFVIDEDTGMVSVGDADIPDSEFSADGTDVPYTFQIKVSDGVTANDQLIDATVTVDANSPVALAGAAALDGGTLEFPVTVTAADVLPRRLVGLQELVNDPDGNPVSFEISNDPPHVVYSEETDELLLTYLPTAPREEPTEIGRAHV